MTNPPQPQTDEFQKDSSLDADRGYDKTKIKNEGVPVDSAMTGIPIALVGKDKSMADSSEVHRCRICLAVELTRASPLARLPSSRHASKNSDCLPTARL